MTHRVVLHVLAKKDLRDAYERVAEHAPESAARWLSRFEASLQTLEENPRRCPFARENSKVDVEIREFLFGKRPHVFRVIFTIDESEVRILRIRRAQRRFLTSQEIKDAHTGDEKKLPRIST
jgi:plasmid stabilization system protein ParE